MKAFVSEERAEKCPQPLDALVENVDHYWSLLNSYFGKGPSDSMISRHGSSTDSRILLFIVFFFGNLVFMTYKASLTSELSTRRQILPFDSLERLIQSDYRLVCSIRTCNI